MCFGSSKAPAVPPPAQPTRFEYLPANGKSQQQQAAATKPETASYGAELGSSTVPVATKEAM